MRLSPKSSDGTSGIRRPRNAKNSSVHAQERIESIMASLTVKLVKPNQLLTQNFRYDCATVIPVVMIRCELNGLLLLVAKEREA